MKYCIIEVFSQSATFRNPEFQNFHKTLSLPPPTTMIGLAGAAMGLSPQKAQAFFNETSTKLGVYGKSEGLAGDLWKFDTLDPKPDKRRSIILREVLYANSFLLVYGNEDKTKVDQLVSAFQNPVFALTLGNSDNLIKVNAEISTVEELTQSKTIAHCLVAGDIIAEVLTAAAFDPVFSIYTTSEPIVLDIPTHFNYESEYGMRAVVKRKTLSFVGKQMELNVLKDGVEYKDCFIPVFDYSN